MYYSLVEFDDGFIFRKKTWRSRMNKMISLHGGEYIGVSLYSRGCSARSLECILWFTWCGPLYRV